MNYKIEESCLRYIVPFTFQGDLRSALSKVEAERLGEYPKWIREVDSVYMSDLYDYVRSEFHFESTEEEFSAEKQGYRWVINGSLLKGKKIRKNNPGVPPLLSLKYFPKADMKTYYTLEVRNMGLALFKNRLGFFWYDIEWKDKDLDTDRLVPFQNRFRNLNVKDPFLWYCSSEKTEFSFPLGFEGDTALFIEPFQFADFIARNLKFLDVSFLAERDSALHAMAENACMQKKMSREDAAAYADGMCEGAPARVPRKALLFTFCSMEDLPGEKAAGEEEAAKRRRMAYYLTNGYDRTYHMSEQVASGMAYPFEDAIWFATQEGAAYLGWPMADHKRFFDEVLSEKVQYDYFGMYLKLLYQSYSLLLYAQRIQDEISEEVPEQEITALAKEIQLFLTKSMATSVSNVHHQTEFYTYIKKALRIREDVDSVLAGVEALAALQREERYQNERREEKATEEAEKKRDEKIQAGVGFLSILAIFSAWTDLYDFITKLADGSENSWMSLLKNYPGIFALELLGAAVVLAIGIFAAVYAVRAIVNAWRKDKS